MKNYPTILIVDDDDGMRTMVKKHVKEHFPNHQIVETTDLQTATEHLDKHNVVGAVIDGSFPRFAGEDCPEECGHELARILNDRHTPRVMLTGEGGSFTHKVRLTKTPVIRKGSGLTKLGEVVSEAEHNAARAVGILKRMMAKVAQVGPLR